MQLDKEKTLTATSLLRNRGGLMLDAVLAYLRHFLFEFSAGKFIFGLYAVLILGGTAVLFLSQAERLQMEKFNIPFIVQEELNYLGYLWHEGTLTPATFWEALATLKANLSDDGYWGLLNSNNFNIFMDSLFTATSAVCLTGMTSCDITVFPEDVIFLLSGLGAGSLMSFALLFNIHSYFQTDISSQGAFSLHDFTAAKKLGLFTIKVMYTIVVLGTLVLTLYFLPPESLRTFLRQELLYLRSYFATR